MLRGVFSRPSCRFLLGKVQHTQMLMPAASQKCLIPRISCSKKSLLSNLLAHAPSCHLMSTQVLENGTKDDVQNSEESATYILANLSAEEQRRLKVLQVEADVWMSLGHRVPEEFTDEMWLSVLREHNSANKRRKVYRFWFKNEKLRWKETKLKAERAVVHAERLAQKQQLKDEGNYMEKNTFLQYVREATMSKFYYNNIAFSATQDINLLIDMGFEENMDKKELANLIKQLVISHGFNKVAQEPFHFHLCNLKPGSETEKQLLKRGPGWEGIPYTNSAEHYLDLYPKDKLVYLTPNSRTYLERFDHDSVYILGGIVDLHGDDRLTFAEARKHKLRTAKLPLDKYLLWKQGTKSLTMDQMTRILLTLKDTNDWQQALRHIPTRKTWR